MSKQLLGGLGLTGEYDEGENGWTESMNNNLQILNNLSTSDTVGPILVFATVPDPTNSVGPFLDANQEQFKGVYIRATTYGSPLGGVFEGKPNWLAQYLGNGEYRAVKPTSHMVIQQGTNELKYQYFNPIAGPKDENGEDTGGWLDLYPPSFSQVQADWNERDSYSSAYINNKPLMSQPNLFEANKKNMAYIQGSALTHEVKSVSVENRFIKKVVYGVGGIQPVYNNINAYDEVGDLFYKLATPATKILCSRDLMHWWYAYEGTDTINSIFASGGELIVVYRKNSSTSLHRLNVNTKTLEPIAFNHGLDSSDLNIMDVVKNGSRYFIHAVTFMGSPVFKGVIVSDGSNVVNTFDGLENVYFYNWGAMTSIFYVTRPDKKLRIKEWNGNQLIFSDYMLDTLPASNIDLNSLESLVHKVAIHPMIGLTLNWNGVLYKLYENTVTPVIFANFTEYPNMKFSLTSVTPDGDIFGGIDLGLIRSSAELLRFAFVKLIYDHEAAKYYLLPLVESSVPYEQGGLIQAYRTRTPVFKVAGGSGYWWLFAVCESTSGDVFKPLSGQRDIMITVS